MRFQECQERREQDRIGRPLPQLLSPNSGQIEKTLRPARVTKRCRKRSKRKG